MRRIEIGTRYVRWTVTAKAHRSGYWECRCDCGCIRYVKKADLVRGKSQSCGCLRIEQMTVRNITHQKTGSPEYRVWASMWERCRNPDQTSYPWYGGRGIKVCDRWLRFENFLADMGPRPPGWQIDRKDSNGDYEPENCRWATVLDQRRNQRSNILVTHQGKTQPFGAWVEELGIKYTTAYSRYYRGSTPERALFGGS